MRRKRKSIVQEVESKIYRAAPDPNCEYCLGTDPPRRTVEVDGQRYARDCDHQKLIEGTECT